MTETHNISPRGSFYCLFSCTYGIRWQWGVRIFRRDTVNGFGGEQNVCVILWSSGLRKTIILACVFQGGLQKRRVLISWRVPATIIISAALFPQTRTDDTNKLYL